MLFSEKDRDNYFNLGRRVVCSQCREAGKSMRDAKGNVRYTEALLLKECSSCCMKKAPHEFRKQGNIHVAACKACEPITCAACSESKASLAFTASTRVHHFTHSRQVVCAACAALGRSVKRPQLYRCNGPCGLELGAARFDAKILAGTHRTGGGLTCEGCMVAERSREAKLNRQVVGSKMVCHCKPPWTAKHKEACRFHPLNVRDQYMWEDKLPGPAGRADSKWLLERKRSKQL